MSTKGPKPKAICDGCWDKKVHQCHGLNRIRIEGERADVPCGCEACHPTGETMTDDAEVAEVLARRLKEADIDLALRNVRRHAQDERMARELKERAVSAARDLGASPEDIEGALHE